MNRKNTIKTIIFDLFPGSAGVGWSPDWADQRRICHERYFDNYFLISVRDDEVSESDIGKFIDCLDSLDDSMELLDEFDRQGKLYAALAKLESAIGDVQIDKIPVLLTSLFNIGDRTRMQWGLSLAGIAQPASYLVRECLSKLDELTRYTVLKEAIETTNGLHLPVIAVQEQLSERYRADANFPTLSEHDVHLLKALLIEKIASEAKERTLFGRDEVARVLFAWAEWVSKDVVGEWIKCQFTSPSGLLDFLMACVSPSAINGVPHWALRRDTIEALVDFRLVEKRFADVDLSQVADKHRLACDLFSMLLNDADSQRHGSAKIRVK